MICEVVVNGSECETRKACSRLNIFSVTGNQWPQSKTMAEIAISNTSLWQWREGIITATGDIEILTEKENYGLYKIKFQVQRWKETKKVSGTNTPMH